MGDNIEFGVPEKEKFNTGVGYYVRINELLNECVRSRMMMNKLLMYNANFSLYVELLAKCSEKEKEILKAKFEELISYMGQQNKVSNIPDNILTNFELHLRELLERKNMLTPKGEDPSSSLGRM